MRRVSVRDKPTTRRTYRLSRQGLVLLTAVSLLLSTGCSSPEPPPPEPSLPAAIPQEKAIPATAPELPDTSTAPEQVTASQEVPEPPDHRGASQLSPPVSDGSNVATSDPTASPETSGQVLPATPDSSGELPAASQHQEEDATAGNKASPLTLDALLQISEGMTYEEIRTILGEPGVRVAGSESSGEIYRWSAGGLSFTARIENGKLVRKRILEDGRPVRGPNRIPEKNLDQALYDAIREGMTFDQVLAILGMEPQPVLRPDSDVVVYRWSDPSGASFTARFENGVLVRKNGLYMLPRNKATSETPVSNAESAPGSGEQAAPESENRPATGQEHPPVPAEPSSAEPAPESAVASSETDSVSETATSNTAKAPAQETPPATASKPENSAEKPSRQRIRRASLPRFAHRLRSGSYEIRVNNLSDSDVEAALLSDNGGLRLDLRAGTSQSVKVPEGNYVLYFIYDKEPGTLNRGSVIPISEWRADVDLFLIGESYDIRALERSGESPKRGRRR